MTLAEMAEDVRETLRAHDALPCALVGHSLGGKVAMMAALQAPDAVSRLLVGDIAPVVYGGHGAQYERYLAAMAALPLTPGLTRAAADAALAAAVPDASVRAFLLQNLQPGEAPRWQINLAAIGAGLARDPGVGRAGAARPMRGRRCFLPAPARTMSARSIGRRSAPCFRGRASLP